MNMSVRYLLLLVAWIVGVGSCIVWGQEQTWIAGLSIILVSSATLAAAYFTDVGAQDKQRFTIGGSLFLLLGLLLLYVGLANP
jgi:hypothetical protein